jgi:hypothetical protein
MNIQVQPWAKRASTYQRRKPELICEFKTLDKVLKITTEHANDPKKYPAIARFLSEIDELMEQQEETKPKNHHTVSRIRREFK